MKIIMFSINPIFPDVVTGGASKHLYHIARYLGKQGHQVKILSAQLAEDDASFTWSENVIVDPVLPFHLPFPQPYAISGADLTRIVSIVAGSLKDADRFYIHDGEFLIPDVYEPIPTIISYRDNIYPESVLGSFIGKGDDIICVSDYSAKLIQSTTGRFYPGLKERMHQINNGIDLKLFSPVDPTELAKSLGVVTEKTFILLHPHRPEPGKGLQETIQVVHRLVHQHDLKNIKVLVPEWIEAMVSAGDSAFYQNMLSLMEDLEVKAYFKFIPWIPLDKIAAFFSLGDVTLCLGNIVEAFGNVAYESLACGTPSIVARVGVHRTLMPDELIDKVNFGDIDSAVDVIRSIINEHKKPNRAVHTFLQSEMSFSRQIEAYAEIITKCEKRERMQFVLPAESSDQKYMLAPW
ncbi:MAG: glycosyltransferase family 4 protein, partial [Anaerolineales bacterium]